MLEKLGNLLQGKKTYIVTGLAIAITAYQLITGNPIPSTVWAILGALGLGAVRSAIDKIGK